MEALYMSYSPGQACPNMRRACPGLFYRFLLALWEWGCVLPS
mgnify:CR=1 FL=1